MSAARLLSDLNAAGFSLSVENGGIAVRPAPRLTDTERAAIRANKAELIRLLSEAGEERAAILEVDAGLSRPDAEARAAMAHPPAPANQTRPFYASDERLADDRRSCGQCLNLDPADGRCLASGQRPGASRYFGPADPELLHRCILYRPDASDSDPRPGSDRWQWRPDERAAVIRPNRDQAAA